MHIYAYILHWILAIVLGLFGWWLIFMNFAVVYLWIVRRKHSSWIPLVGGFFALAGMAFCPVLEIRRFAFVPLFIGVSYCVLALAIGFLTEIYARKKKRSGTAPEKTGQ